MSSDENGAQDKVPGTLVYPNDDAHEPETPKYFGQYGDIKLFFGTGSDELCGKIAKHLDITPGKKRRKVFSNENIFIWLDESVRGQDVYLVQTMQSPLHEKIMEMLIMIDALKRDSAGRINLVIPYFPYGRSDKKDQPRVPITARLMANMIEVAGADRYMTIDLHAGQIQGFFNIPGDALTAFHLLVEYIAKKKLENLVVVTTDLGFAKKGRNWAERLDTPLAFVEKRRVGNDDKAEAMSIIGDVAGKNVLLVDDEVNTAGSMEKAVAALRERGAKDIYLAFTHALLTGPACDRLRRMNVKEIVTTDTIPQSKDVLAKLPNMTVLSVGPLLAEVILRAHQGRSVGKLFRE
ncbi:MAG: ribose-phosphate pyrophosphokinase [Chloroflexi bacterium]|nr:MAG: ribose-phosphate pyrophosphokinase [Chloroflexota bacterium]